MKKKQSTGTMQKKQSKKQSTDVPSHLFFRIRSDIKIQVIKPAAAAKKAMAEQRKKVAEEPAPMGNELPKWVQTLVKKKAGTQEIIQAAVSRGLKKRDHESLMEIKAVLNEFGRDRDSAAEVVRAITVDNVNKLKK